MDSFSFFPTSGVPPWENLSVVRIVLAIAVNVALGYAAYKKESVDVSGWVVGAIWGSLVWICLGWQGFMMLLVFFVGGSAASKHKLEQKQALGIAQEQGGRRSWRHASANVSVPAIIALLAVWGYGSPAMVLSFIGAFAAAFSDTTSSELGQLYGRTPFMITTLRRAPVGTDGAVSVEGTLMGVAAATLLGVVAWLVGLTSLAGIVVVIIAGTVGNFVDSYLGATLERQGVIGNEAVNFANTIAGALAGGLLGLLVG